MLHMGFVLRVLEKIIQFVIYIVGVCDVEDICHLRAEFAMMSVPWWENGGENTFSWRLLNLPPMGTTNSRQPLNYVLTYFIRDNGQLWPF